MLTTINNVLVVVIMVLAIANILVSLYRIKAQEPKSLV